MGSMTSAVRTAAVQLGILLLGLLAGCADQPQAAQFQGYAEGEYVLVAAPFAGALTALHVRRGETVAADAPLFELEREQETAAEREARERLRSAQAQTRNLSEARRPLELQAARAEVEQAQAALEQSRRDLQRDEKLFRDGFVSQARLDASRSAYERDLARVAQARAQARLGRQSVGREQEIAAARAQSEAARAALEQSRWRVEQKAQRAPEAGLVFDTFFVPGEWVPAGRPVVSLLPPANIKVRFFVPETMVGSLGVGQPVSVHCDGCAAPIPATVSYISPQPEYTPPVIYSERERAKLVFLIEARPAPSDATRLKPGQPVDVRLQ
ncbi:MAG TPA: HlyD family efflux transporter periplasmic adaptor subunit [Burkholderiales bacterium]|nr:HlyD family efflux transporter periplasmic adaptor subunit [Burkholderiales bacterium]